MQENCSFASSNCNKRTIAQIKININQDIQSRGFLCSKKILEKANV